MATLSLLLASLLVAAASILGTASAEFNLNTVIDQANYNIYEDAKLTCTITSDETIGVGIQVFWYKKQEEEYVALARHENMLFGPFEKLTDKYRVSADASQRKVFVFFLQINGVESVDTGEYKCTAGYKGEPEVESNVVNLLVNPSEGSTQLTLDTSAPQEGDYFYFNTSNKITCKGQTNTKSSGLSLVVKTKDGTEITQDFKFTQSQEWVGGTDGLKLPTSTYKLEAMNWALEKPGKEELFCSFSDGERELLKESLKVIKPEVPTMNCSTNYKRPVKASDDDVYIRCEVQTYSGSTKYTFFSWHFVSEETGENSTLRAGDTSDPQRIVKQDKLMSTLEIVRVSKAMVSVGKTFPYKIRFCRQDNGETVDIASAEFNLPLDNTRPSTENSSSTIYSSMSYLLLLPLLAFLTQRV